MNDRKNERAHTTHDTAVEPRLFDEHADDATEARELDALWSALGQTDEPDLRHDLRPRFNTMIDAYRQGLEEGRAEARAANHRVANAPASDAAPESGSVLAWSPRTTPSAGSSTGPGTTRRASAWQWGSAVAAAAGVALVIGLAWGRQDTAPGEEIAGLRDEMANLSRTVATTLLTHGSASERLNAVRVAREGAAEDDTVLDALVDAVREDPSTSVRLAAIEALGPMVRERDAVRAALAEILLASHTTAQPGERPTAGSPPRSRATSQPLVQIALVDTFLAAGEPGRRIVDQLGDGDARARLDPSVRDHLDRRLARERGGASL